MQESEAGGEQLEFVALHFAGKLRIINPRARLGVVTLWSKIEFVEQKLAELGVDLEPDTSKIAVLGNLYGNGIPHLLRNLLYNPQIRDLVVCGADRSHSEAELVAFFERGLEETVNLGETVHRIRGTSRVIDALVTPERFGIKPRITCVGSLRSEKSVRALRDYVDGFVPGPADGERIEVELPEVCVTHYPSEPRNHNIVADKPLAAWRELVFRLVRFGHLTHLRKGDRQELQNVRVVVRYPREDAEEELEKLNFSLDGLRQYQSDMLVGSLPEDQAYTYGNRIRQYFGFDALRKFAERLIDNPQDRDCYLALWNSRCDIDADDAPCLVSMFFRLFDEKLTMTATYRTHNALDAWLKNVYGLMKVQEIVAREAALEVGPLTVISHSISVDPSNYDLARRVSNAKGFSLEMDPNGQFTVGIEDGQIVARHLSNEGELLYEYRSRKAERIQHEINRDCAISDINHAMYVGSQLARAEECLGRGVEFEEG